jgi:hypothetical protein
MQEAHDMIEEETPQLDPEELDCNVKLWKQQAAEASCKHRLALKRKAKTRTRPALLQC